MAAFRENVPFRSVDSVFKIEDGTMCRMPSPMPGPLREQQDRETVARKNVCETISSNRARFESDVGTFDNAPAATVDKINEPAIANVA